MKYFVFIFFVTCFLNEGNCQLDSLSKEILSKVFSHKDVSEKVFERKWRNQRSAFICVTKELTNNVQNQGELLIQMNPEFGTLAFLFQIGQDSVYVFRDPIALGTYSKYDIQRVILVEKLLIAKSKAKVKIRTTNLNTNRFNNNEDDQFCILSRLEISDSDIRIISNKIERCSFKEIL